MIKITSDWVDDEVKKELDDINILGETFLRYSDFTDMFYVHIPSVEIKDKPRDYFLSDICEHRVSKKDALMSYSKRIKEAGVVVVNAYDKDRSEYKWNGKRFKII